ncbi:C-terminal helicase domain-containing protein [Treponema pectinovorum]|uniref:C-terminal helicase domain-containing protein n=1 Tax=Treponema pectinovorum TaxID=164 RepID=UPI0011CABDE9|nr:C-terminal helicase domain-containing protein [Treponema pectinovorum]
MQVEPVVTTSPEVYEDFLKDKFSLNIEKYALNIKSESVQTYADRLNPYGSYIESQADIQPVWVGCPLIVHRRCINPMFDISNELSYGGMMINSTASKEKDFLLQESCWIDISGKETGNKNHFILEQYGAVKSLLEQKEKTSETTMFIITPFVSVKSGFKDIKDIQIGTVHTFQGKEADEVFLVLGCDKNSKGAINWVNANIINVAVTRAKYRLYVVGDWNLWSSNKNVALMQNHLPRKNITDFIPEIKNEESKMSEIIKNELVNILEKIEQMEDEAYEKGRKSAFEELAEKMKNEKISSDMIEKITGIKIEEDYTYEKFINTYSKEDYSITVTFYKE